MSRLLRIRTPNTVSPHCETGLKRRPAIRRGLRHCVGRVDAASRTAKTGRRLFGEIDVSGFNMFQSYEVNEPNSPMS